MNMTQSAKLTASDGAAGDNYGNSVSISGNTVVVGAPQAAVGANAAQGAAYVSGNSQTVSPFVQGISPASGPVKGGMAVTITGTSLANATAVMFGRKAAKISSDSATQILVTSPAGKLGTVDVTVVTANGTSATRTADQYTYVRAPTVTKISATSGPTTGGTSVTIAGANLANTTAVMFGKVAVTTFTSDAANEIVVASPAGAAGKVDVRVVTAGGTSAITSKDKFTYFLEAATASLSPPSTPTSYSITDLGTLPGYTCSSACGINDRGQVVGDCYNLDADGDVTAETAFLYSNGTMTNLGTLPGYTCSSAYGINDSGQVVGDCCNLDAHGDVTAETAFLYSNGTMTNLGTLGGEDSCAYGISDNGYVVGGADTASGDQHAFLYSNGTMTDLGTLGGEDSCAQGVNDNGQVVGSAENATTPNQDQAFFYSKGTMYQLTWGGGAAFGINDSGQVVGFKDGNIAGEGYTEGFLYNSANPANPGPYLPGPFCTAYGINDSGQVVGIGTQYSLVGNTSNETFTDLPYLPGGNYNIAYGISDSGQIVGEATNAEYYLSAVLWSPLTTTSTSLVASPNPSVYGQSVTLTATVAPARASSATPTGTVTFTDAGATLGSGTLNTVNGVASATFTTTDLPAGTDSITATYSGDTYFDTSTSPAISQAVKTAGTATVVATSLSPLVFGQPVTFTATVSVSTLGSGTPTGTVTFKDGSKTLGTGTLSTTSGVTTATFSTAGLFVGNNKITASYSGDNDFMTSRSAAATEVVAKAGTIVTADSSLSPSTSGEMVTFTATVNVSSPGSGMLTGTVTFKDGSKTLGKGKLSTTGGVTTATFATKRLAVGNHQITASYAGNGSFNGSVSTVLVQIVNGPTSATLAFQSPEATDAAILSLSDDLDPLKSLYHRELSLGM